MLHVVLRGTKTSLTILSIASNKLKKIRRGHPLKRHVMMTEPIWFVLRLKKNENSGKIIVTNVGPDITESKV